MSTDDYGYPSHGQIDATPLNVKFAPFADLLTAETPDEITRQFELLERLESRHLLRSVAGSHVSTIRPIRFDPGKRGEKYPPAA